MQHLYGRSAPDSAGGATWDMLLAAGLWACSQNPAWASCGFEAEGEGSGELRRVAAQLAGHGESLRLGCELSQGRSGCRSVSGTIHLL